MVPFKVDLNGKVAVVTGGGGVLCSSMAKAVAACGAHVAVLDLRADEAEKVANEIRETGGTAVACACDALDADSVAAARDEVEEKLGPCDLLINGVGGNNPKGTTEKVTVTPDDLAASLEGTFFSLPREGVSFVFDVNYLSTVLVTQKFAESMARRGQGCVINISSMTALTPLTKVMSYGGAKAALNNFTRWLAVHLAPCGIRVNAIAPGFFLTEQNYSLLMTEDDKPTPRCQQIIDNTPMGRLGKPEELIGTILYLASDAGAGFVSGIVVPIDGGFSAFSGV